LLLSVISTLGRVEETGYAALALPLIRTKRQTTLLARR
jgi:hypothetical protein